MLQKKVNLPLYKLAGAWQVCPQPLEQHFLGEGQCWSDEQLSTHAAANPTARCGGGQSPWRDSLREARKSLLVTHSFCFWEKEQGGNYYYYHSHTTEQTQTVTQWQKKTHCRSESVSFSKLLVTLWRKPWRLDLKSVCYHVRVFLCLCTWLQIGKM